MAKVFEKNQKYFVFLKNTIYICVIKSNLIWKDNLK